MRMHDNRPNPDALLARVQEEETQQGRGKLKIFFGATAGVGKTYAMLEAATPGSRRAWMSWWAGSIPMAGPRPKPCSQDWRCCHDAQWRIAARRWVPLTSTRRWHAALP